MTLRSEVTRELTQAEIDEELTRLYVARGKLQAHSKLAANSIKGYGYDMQLFEAWCNLMQRSALPATEETVSLYLTSMLTEGLKVTTAHRRASAIASAHRERKLPCPVNDNIRSLLRGAQRLRGEKAKQATPLTVAQLRAMARLLAEEDTPGSLRNRAILVIGFSSALRRANLCALQLSDVESADEGLILHISREKQDQMARGRFIGLPRGGFAETCPVRALEDYLTYRGRRPGPLFCRFDKGQAGKLLAMRGEAIERMVKVQVAGIGLDPKLYSPHSLRSGFITEAGENGAGELLIAAQSGHRNMDTLRKYFRRSEVFKANAAARLGL